MIDSVTLAKFAAHDIDVTGLLEEDIDVLRALARGFSLHVIASGELRSEMPESQEDAAEYTEWVRQLLVRRGLLAGGDGNNGPLDRWRYVAACPKDCRRDHRPVDEMDGEEGFHHDLESLEYADLEAIDLALGEGSQAVGGWISLVPCVWVPPLFDDPDGTGMKANPDPVVEPLVEIQDEQKRILVFTGAEVAGIADALRCAGEATLAAAAESLAA
jgi:hypothetical protein